MNPSEYHLDKTNGFVVSVSGSLEVGLTGMYYNTFDGLRQTTTDRAGEIQVAACFLNQAQASELADIAKVTDQIDLIECCSVGEVIALLAANKVKMAVVDVSLSGNWPTSDADRLCDAVTDNSSVIVVCNGSEADGHAVQMHCEHNPNVTVVMGQRYDTTMLFELCISTIRLKQLRPSPKFI